MDEELDFTKLKYVLYARKSTTDETRQVRSIPDQIDDCEKLAFRMGLNIADTLHETKSAKKPHQRPIFNKMLADIRKGIYNAILAWNPDRLARNMLEGGAIIDMIDEGQIKDLKFVTHHFTKDANGKMLLGMSFVLSKQYSDDLSQKVTRGVRKSFLEGKTPTPKHGYINEDGIYRPDGVNFELIRDAWKMRQDGDSLQVITDYLNSNEYSRTVKRTGRKIDMDTKILTDLFKDPFYYGVLIQAKQTVDLRELYAFQPAVTEDMYNQIQEQGNRRLKPLNTNRRLTFYPLKAMVHCFFCGHNMVVGPSTSNSGKKLLYYRCDNKLCTRQKKSIRAKVIFNWVYDFLAKNFKFTEDDYKQYYAHLTTLTDRNREKVKIQIHSKEASLKSIEREVRELSLGLIRPQKPIVRQQGEKRLSELEVEKITLTGDVKKLRDKLTDPDKDKLSLEQFLNLSKEAAKRVQSGGPVQKDAICREIFLNFTVDEEKVLSYQAKPVFEAMLKTRQSTTSRTGANDLELLTPLADSIISNWDLGHFDPKILTIQSQNQYNYNQLYEY